MYYVVGSGPAGVACASALAASGHSITILDGGVSLEPGRDSVRRSAASKQPKFWTRNEIDILRTLIPKHGDLPQKLVYGSDYPYRRAKGSPTIDYGGMNIRASYARGGLSNVWGAALLPYRRDDIPDWPISDADLSDGYAGALGLMPLSSKDDELSPYFPLFAQPTSALEPCRQVASLLRKAEGNRARLNAEGVFVGSARLAVGARRGPEDSGCYYCGYCLHGCPRDLVYSSRHTVTDLIERGQIVYRPGVLVRSLHERGEKVLIDAILDDGESVKLEADRVFLGAGTFNTTAILLRSLERYDDPVCFKDSQYFLFPLLQLSASPLVAEEAKHTLAQAFIEIFDCEISPYTVHLQVYGHSDHLGQALDHKLGPFKHLMRKNALLGRLLLIQGYMHSDHSGSIVGTLRRTDNGDLFQLAEVPNPDTRAKVRLVLRKMARQSRKLGAVPVVPLLKIAETGRGFHVGGSFPMAARPGPGQTDELGRPQGLVRTHVIDATTFPSIPATTITLTVMANAYRIGTKVSGMDILRVGSNVNG